jgi:hypothetical protein
VGRFREHRYFLAFPPLAGVGVLEVVPLEPVEVVLEVDDVELDDDADEEADDDEELDDESLLELFLLP